MKKIKFTIVLILVCNFVFSQNDLVYEGVITTDSVSKEVLYSRGLIWFAEYFKDSQEVIQVEDKESGKVVGKGSFRYVGIDKYYKGYINFTVKLMFKDGRFKYILSNFTHTSTNIKVGLITTEETASFKAFTTQKYKNREWNNMKSEIKMAVEHLKKSLISEISIPDSKEEDW